MIKNCLSIGYGFKYDMEQICCAMVIAIWNWCWMNGSVSLWWTMVKNRRANYVHHWFYVLMVHNNGVVSTKNNNLHKFWMEKDTLSVKKVQTKINRDCTLYSLKKVQIDNFFQKWWIWKDNLDVLWCVKQGAFDVVLI